MAERNRGPDVAVVADDDPGADDGLGADAAARADFGARLDDRAGVDLAIGAKRRGGVDESAGGDSRPRQPFGRVEKARGAGPGEIGGVATKERRAFGGAGGHRRREDYRFGAGRGEVGGVAAVVEEGEIARFRAVQGRNPGNAAGGVALVRELCADATGERADLDRLRGREEPRIRHPTPCDEERTIPLPPGAESPGRRGAPR